MHACALVYYATLRRSVQIVPIPGTVVTIPYSIVSQKWRFVRANLSLAHSVDGAGYTHYCYKYRRPVGSSKLPLSAPESRRDAELESSTASRMSGRQNTADEHGAFGPEAVCGDGGAITVNSTNVHFHGMKVPPTCHQDDVINTLIQPGTAGFQYNIHIPQASRPACIGTTLTSTALLSFR